MNSQPPQDNWTTQLLLRVRQNDRAALNELLRHVMPRIDRWIRRKRTPAVQGRFDTQDCTQDVAINLVQYLPTIEVSDSDTFHGLLYRMIVNSLKSKQTFLMARRRRMTREQPLVADATVCLDPVDPNAPSPSVLVERKEREGWLRVGLALLSPTDQELVLLHHFDQESFVEIGERLKLSPDTVRMRFHRAMTKLNAVITKLRDGRAKELGLESGWEEETGEEP